MESFPFLVFITLLAAGNTPVAGCGPASAVAGDWNREELACVSEGLGDGMTLEECGAACDAAGADLCALFTAPFSEETTCIAYVEETPGACRPGESFSFYMRWQVCGADVAAVDYDDEETNDYPDVSDLGPTSDALEAYYMDNAESPAVESPTVGSATTSDTTQTNLADNGEDNASSVSSDGSYTLQTAVVTALVVCGLVLLGLK